METIERGKQKKTNLYDEEGDREKQTKKTQGNNQRQTNKGKQAQERKETKATCIESKKKNMMRRETEAPRGRHIACTLSRVVTLFSRLQSIF